MLKVINILLQHPTFTNQTLFTLASTSKSMRDLINQKAQVIDINLSLPPQQTDDWCLVLHPCIINALQLRTLRLEIEYHCGYACGSGYVHVTAHDLASLACCPNLQHLTFVQNNNSGSYTDPDEYYDYMKEELAGLSQLNLAEIWPVLESIHFDVDSYYSDFIMLNIRTLSRTCHTLTCNLYEEQFADIPSSVTALNTLATELSEQHMIRLSTSDAVRESSLLFFTSSRYTRKPQWFSLLPACLIDIAFPSLDIGGSILNQLYSNKHSMRHLVNLKSLYLGGISLKDFDEPNLECLSQYLPSGLSVLRFKLYDNSLQHWDRPNDERIKLFAKYFAARLEIENYDESGAPK